MQVAASIFSSLGRSSFSKKSLRFAVAASVAFLISAAGVLFFNSFSSSEAKPDAAAANGEPKIPSIRYTRCLLYAVQSA